MGVKEREDRYWKILRICGDIFYARNLLQFQGTCNNLKGKQFAMFICLSSVCKHVSKHVCKHVCKRMYRNLPT